MIYAKLRGFAASQSRTGARALRSAVGHVGPVSRKTRGAIPGRGALLCRALSAHVTTASDGRLLSVCTRREVASKQGSLIPRRHGASPSLEARGAEVTQALPSCADKRVAKVRALRAAPAKRAQNSGEACVQDPLQSSWLGYSALARATRARAPVAEYC